MEGFKVCCICGQVFAGFGNNPWPIVRDDGAECCDECNANFVIPARIDLMLGHNSGDK